MKKSFFVSILFVLSFLFFSCVGSSPLESDGNRFQVVYYQPTTSGHLTKSVLILKDTYTGDRYLVVSSGYGLGLTKMDH